VSEANSTHLEVIPHDKTAVKTGQNSFNKTGQPNAPYWRLPVRFHPIRSDWSGGQTPHLFLHDVPTPYRRIDHGLGRVPERAGRLDRAWRRAGDMAILKRVEPGLLPGLRQQPWGVG
jgi:hypothetical protein